MVNNVQTWEEGQQPLAARAPATNTSRVSTSLFEGWRIRMQEDYQDAGWGIPLAPHAENKRTLLYIATAGLSAVAFVVVNLLLS